MKNYGQELKAHREYNKLTQSQLAKLTGIKQQNISRWENNSVIPSIEHCEILANFYEITIDELIGRENKINAKKTTFEIKGTINNKY